MLARSIRQEAIQAGRKKINMMGRLIGRLKVNAEARKAKNGVILWECSCTCGKTVLLPGNSLRNGHAVTCGHCLSYTDYGSYMIGTDVNGAPFQFDTEDWDKVKEFRWWVGCDGYVCADDKKRRRIKLHNIIINPPGDLVADHINGDRADCRKANLRWASIRENSYNSKLSRRNSTGFKGVYYDRHRGKYEAYIRPNGAKKHLGRYTTAHEAARAYNVAASFYFGEFAKLNKL